MPTDRGKLTAFPTIHRGIAGYAYRVVFTRSYRAPNGERIPANFNGLEAELKIYPANKQGPPLISLATTPTNSNLFFTLNGADRVALTWFPQLLRYCNPDRDAGELEDYCAECKPLSSVKIRFTEYMSIYTLLTFLSYKYTQRILHLCRF